MRIDAYADGWFHGTRRPYRKGGLLLPRAVHGGAPTTAPLEDREFSEYELRVIADSVNWVYMTDEPMLAWHYALAAPGRGKPRVLILQPSDDIEPDPEHSALMSAWRCRYAYVLGVSMEPTLEPDGVCDCEAVAL